MPANLLRNLPSVSELLEHPQLQRLRQKVSHSVVVSRARSILDDLRTQVQSAAADMHWPTPAELAERIARRVTQSDEPRLRRVINATGVLLPAGLGRAPLADEAIAEVAAVARDYSSVELDLATGASSARALAVEGLLRELTGAESALAVNNTAGATLLALAALAVGKEVVVSRGELIEFDDGYRLPEMIAASGARLREVGTTNHTRPDDYRGALGEESAALLLVHARDRRAPGSTGVELAELVRLGRERRLPVLHVLGGAAFFDMASVGCPGEPQARDSIAVGADVAVISGDKLAGGPQCGLIVGRRELIERMARHPLARALRCDKLTLAALSATLRLYRTPDVARREVPLLSLLDAPLANLQNRAERIAPQMAACGAVSAAEAFEDTCSLEEGRTHVPPIPTWCVALRPATGDVERLAAALRTGAPAVVGRVRDGRLLFDLRTVFPRQDQDLIAAVAALTPPAAATSAAAPSPATPSAESAPASHAGPAASDGATADGAAAEE